ncbi:hypothetical protein CBM2592_P80015 [Cupriavidus taiwanensis]|uniref:Uncharacterized protein n=2 Tax=Cupriavidus TaxID=106589 RepID=A0A375HZJ4_9BURK|nr:hypothetical protein CBM2592_P80015 [Cupriavidus taiwanensis]SOZ40766.1 hypothetical protein CBM2605_P60016 [Cupriavidus neocaledonicus]SOZ00821.1 hypothetical protein CBM2591_P80015 [Cupriavidus taiwanensis]SOZ21039.1 hypothetical protein CBM2595_P60015 [Cupriavidus taiwanensis]SOZ33000.1 hypothetical protein CBM2608_P80016 [Cupriavidus taiwanensis]
MRHRNSPDCDPQEINDLTANSVAAGPSQNRSYVDCGEKKRELARRHRICMRNGACLRSN